jgi:hypothetical protein
MAKKKTTKKATKKVNKNQPSGAGVVKIKF